MEAGLISAIPTTQEIRRTAVWDQPGQKVSETPFQQKQAGCGGMHLSSQLWERL
jgi:hypothetical protein